MKYAREYKADVTGGVLHVGVDEKKNWYVDLKGGKWVPVQISDRPIWIDNRKWSKIPEKFEIEEDQWNLIRSEIQDAEEHLETDEASDDGDYTDKIKTKAKELLADDTFISFWMDQYHKNHHGDDIMGMGWLCSFASGQSITSEGIQPTAHSEDPGMGKTDSAKAAFHCIHTRRDLETSVSAMSLYRDKSLTPGDIISSDDVEWSTGLVSTVKRSMSNFQRETFHTTLDNNNELAKYSLPPRLLWWFTSVESSANDQIIDRQFLFDVDDSKTHHTEINDDIKRRRASGILKFEVDDDILIARCVTYFIRHAGPFKVQIPYGNFIDWKLPRGHRDFNRFLDLIDALAILRYNHRSPEKGDDVTGLVATIGDYNDAKSVFVSRQKNIRTHLTNSETHLLNAMTERDEWSQSELVDRTGMKQGTISKRLAALLEKSNYVKMWMDSGEKRYAVTDKVDMTLFANEIVDLKIPTSGFITAAGERYSAIFQPYSKFIPIENDSNIRYKENIFQNSKDSQGKENDEILDEEEIVSGGDSDKTGINTQNQQRAGHSCRNNQGIRKECDGNINGSGSLQDTISEAERTSTVLNIDELVRDWGKSPVRDGPTEYEICETLKGRGWNEGKRGAWAPKSRTR